MADEKKKMSVEDALGASTQPDWEAFLADNPGAKAVDDYYKEQLAEMDKFHDSLVHGDNPPPAASETTGDATFRDERGHLVSGAAPQSGFVINSNGGQGYRIDARATVAKQDLPGYSSLTPEADWRAQFQPRLGGVSNAAPPTAPNVAAPLLPPAYQQVGQSGRIYPSAPNTTFSPYGTVSSNPIAGSTFGSDASVQAPEQFKVASPTPSGIEWPTLPGSPLDQTDRDKYARR